MALLEPNPYESPRYPVSDHQLSVKRSSPWLGTALTILALGSFATVAIAAANLAVIFVLYKRP